MSNNKWKSNLAATSLPLEFEVAKKLVSKKFSVTSDYSYSRKDNGINKDFSVDISAIRFVPFGAPNVFDCELTLLCECKHRTLDTKWLFLPDPNQPDLSPVTVGESIRVIDEFSTYKLKKNAVASFDSDLDYCYKGVEIKLEKGEVFDTEIKHGISQLQYALPRLLADSIRFSGDVFYEHFSRFLFCPILLTNADLFVLNPKVKINDIEKAEELRGVSKQVPYLIFYKDYGPDFEAHCRNEFKNFSELDVFKKLLSMERKIETDDVLSNPSYILKSLMEGSRYALKSYFTQFIVCNLKSFTSLIDEIKKVSVAVVKSKKAKK